MILYMLCAEDFCEVWGRFFDDIFFIILSDQL